MEVEEGEEKPPSRQLVEMEELAVYLWENYIEFVYVVILSRPNV